MPHSTKRGHGSKDVETNKVLCAIDKLLLALKRTERRIMTKISEFAEKQAAFNNRMDSAVQGIVGDVAELNRKIEELQNSPGTITPEDQALLDALEVRGDAISAKLEAIDALTPPPVPAA